VARPHCRGGPAGDDPFTPPPARAPPAEVVDELPQPRAELELVVPRPLDVSREREDDRAGRSLWPERRIPLAALVDDHRDCRDGLDVVDQRRRPVEAAHGRERRPRPRLAALSLPRLEERPLLAPDVRARAPLEAPPH